MHNYENLQPRLFGLNHSNRDFSKPESWGKNQFNSSFPAALACYMSYKSLEPVYLYLDDQLVVNHGKLPVTEFLGINYDSPNLLFAFERDYLPYQDVVIGVLPRVDLVTIDTSRNYSCMRCIEIKLTALPDHTTCNLSENKYSCELVVRPPTIVYIAVSIAKSYQASRHELLNYLQPICSKIRDWTTSNVVLPFMKQLIEIIDLIIVLSVNKQVPLTMQPIWKTQGKSAILHDDCLDILVWSNLAFTRLFIDSSKADLVSKKISRHKRCMLWLVKMLYDFAITGKINHQSIIDEMSFNTKNDKAFALSGVRTHKYLKCPELSQPRIKKSEIKNIILGGGEKFLSPERRFDAVIVNTPNLFI